MKKNLLKAIALTLAVLFVLSLSACSTEKEEPTAAPTETAPSQTETANDPATRVPSPTAAPAADEIARINGGADENGIYSVVVRLKSGAADKGTFELVYYGEKGSPQENSVVNTFRIEYYKEDAGTYEINTFSDGETDQNLHHRNDVTVTNTFGAGLRAGSVIISYTPDGGETREIFRADDEYFR